MASANPFCPAGSLVLATSTSSSRAALPKGGKQCRLLAVGGSDIIYVAFGDDSVAATTTASMRLVPGASEIVTIPEAATHVAAIASANTPSLYVTRGDGM